ncbi:MAG: adenine phosphoribosyltransferase [Candidatus Portnoybacteria bacterium RIFCSPLOWO2_01_FULL_43_11]|uniref:Adenine phosphoribosyltransferase n=1 Tax=Candidatus Portnoybacteria bacterium RIFCSPLOWO2_01_FULL_43_11 TaxID=1802000 RepID=A0A1G2FKC2_9BACT|nr:MAG: adenine phosphoribosyltransferase [Candidatus Portnoybacteria bacterium RIFCSPLOWO2_01_FULL_43_11]
MNLQSKIREIPDFPKKGVSFKDITPLLENAKYFRYLIDILFKKYKDKKIKKIVAIDARGFLIASALAYKLKTGIVIVRKKGKLPFKTVGCDYDLEYGKETLEIHKDSIKPKERILIIDDVLATGGTALAAAKLVEKLKGKIIGISFLIELLFLNGRKKLKKYNVVSLIQYSS